MAKEIITPIKESTTEDKMVSDSLVCAESNLENSHYPKETDMNLSEIVTEQVPVEIENEEMIQMKDDLDMKKIEEFITKDTVVTVDSDTIDKRQRAITNQRNTYAAKKNIAQGMMDIALITANANQLRYLIEYQRNSPTFYVNVTLIVCSLLLQIVVGICLILKSRFDMRGGSKYLGAKRISNYVIVGIFLTTIINVFVAAFSMSSIEVPSQPSTNILTEKLLNSH